MLDADADAMDAQRAAAEELEWVLEQLVYSSYALPANPPAKQLRGSRRSSESATGPTG